MKYLHRWLATCLIASFYWPAQAESTPPDSSQSGIHNNHETVKPEEDDRREVRNRVVFLPIFFSSPDTRYAFGLLPQYLFYVDPGSRPSQLRMDAFYTQNRQFNVTVRPQVWLKENRYLLAGKLAFKKWPTSFYGIGSDAASGDKEKFTEQSLSFAAEVQRQISPGFFIGAQYTLRRGDITEVEPGGVLQQGDVTGSGTGTASGFGLIASRDTRDDVNFPSSGSLHRFSATFHGKIFGSDYNVSSYALDLRQYISLGGPHVLALQAETRIGYGDFPFRMLPGVGEPLRGYGTTRYIDANRIAVQAEYRVVPLWWRIGLTAFAGVGDVAHRFADFDLKDPKWAVGLGIRFLVYRQEKITIRQDFAFGKDSSGDYLDLNEAF